MLGFQGYILCPPTQPSHCRYHHSCCPLLTHPFVSKVVFVFFVSLIWFLAVAWRFFFSTMRLLKSLPYLSLLAAAAAASVLYVFPRFLGDRKQRFLSDILLQCSSKPPSHPQTWPDWIRLCHRRIWCRRWPPSRPSCYSRIQSAFVRCRCRRG